MFDFSLDEALDFLAQEGGRGDELFHLHGFAVARDHVEEVARVAADDVVAGHQAHVGVELRGHVVVVAGGQVHIAAQAVGLLAHNERDFAVGFQLGHAVEYVAPRLFQRLAPVDIVFLVEAGAHLHQHRHLLALLPGANQRRHDGRLAADAVQGLLDGHHVGVVRRFADEAHHGIEAVVGVIEQNIAAPDDPEDGAILVEALVNAGGEGGKAQLVKARQGRNLLHEIIQVQRPRHGDHAFLRHIQVFLDAGQQPRVAAHGHLQPHHPAPFPLFQVLLHFGDEGVGVGIVIDKIRVPGDAEGHDGQGMGLAEHAVGILGDHVLQQHAAGFAPAHGQQRHPGQRGGHVKQRHARRAAAPHAGGQQQRQMDHLGGQKREGAPIVDGAGRQQRLHRFVKVMAQPFPLLLVQPVEALEMNPRVGQGGQVFRVQQLILPGHLLLYRGENRIQLFPGRQAGGVLFLVPRHGRPHQRAHPHHEEFVQIAGADGDELAPLQQRIVGVRRFLQHPAVKIQPAQFPVPNVAFRHGKSHILHALVGLSALIQNVCSAESSKF